MGILSLKLTAATHLIEKLFSRRVRLDGELQLCVHGGDADVDLENGIKQVTLDREFSSLDHLSLPHERKTTPQNGESLFLFNIRSHAGQTHTHPHGADGEIADESQHMHTVWIQTHTLFFS